jgi:hypothetical protein
MGAKRLSADVAELLLYLYRRGGSSNASFDTDVIRHSVRDGWIEQVAAESDTPHLVLTVAGVRQCEKLTGEAVKRPRAGRKAGVGLTRDSMVQVDGITRTLGEWCDLRHVPIGSVVRRVAAGQPIAEALVNLAEQEPPLSDAARGKTFLFKGERRTLKDWSKVVGVAYHTLRKRMFQGMTLEEAINQPWDKRKSGSVRHLYYTIGDRTQTLKEWCSEYGMPYATIRRRVGKGLDIAVALATPISTSMSRKRTQDPLMESEAPEGLPQG